MNFIIIFIFRKKTKYSAFLLSLLKPNFRFDLNNPTDIKFNNHGIFKLKFENLFNVFLAHFVLIKYPSIPPCLSTIWVFFDLE